MKTRVLRFSSAVFLIFIQPAFAFFGMSGSGSGPSTCSLNDRERLWAQHRLNADLMQSYISDHHLRSEAVHTRVYVIDTGFDPKQLPNMLRPSTMRILPGVYGNTTPGDPTSLQAESMPSLVGNPAHDVGGHGTMVASAIGAKDGIGVAPHADLTVLRVSPSDDPSKSESASDAYVDYAILHACFLGSSEDPDGLTIINASWSDRNDESGKETLETRNPKLINDLLAHGCLVVQAAGNSSFRHQESSKLADGREDPVLRVGATQSFGEMASFSSEGVVSAPGEKVFLLESTAVPRPAADSDRCEPSDAPSSGLPRRFANGTSFAAPFTAGIAAEIAGVLRSQHQEQFKALSPSERIALVTKILQDSQEFGNIDALRAVIAAEQWTAKASTPDFCQSGKNRDAFTLEREQISACPATNDQRLQFANALIREALKRSAFETASGFIAEAIAIGGPTPSVKNLSEIFLRRYLEFLSGNSISDEETDLTADSGALMLFWKLDASLADFILPEHIRSTNGHSTSLMTALLSSRSVEDSLQRGPGRGSEGILASLVSDLALIQGELGPAAVQNIVGSAFTAWQSQLQPTDQFGNVPPLSAMVRVLNTLESRGEFVSIRPFLSNLDRTLFALLDEFPAHFGKDEAPYVLLREIYANRGYVYEFLDRHADLLQPILLDPHPEKFGMVKIEYILDHARPQDLAFVLKIGSMLETSSSWQLKKLEMQSSVSARIADALDQSGEAELSSVLKLLDPSDLNQMQTVNHWLGESGKRLLDFQKANHDPQRPISPSTSVVTDSARVTALAKEERLVSALHSPGLFARFTLQLLKIALTYNPACYLPEETVQAIRDVNW